MLSACDKVLFVANGVQRAFGPRDEVLNKFSVALYRRRVEILKWWAKRRAGPSDEFSSSDLAAGGA